MENLLITKDVLRKENETKLAKGELIIRDQVSLTETVLGGKLGKIKHDARYDAVFSSDGIKPTVLLPERHIPHVIMKYGSAMHAPQTWPDGKVESAYERVRRGGMKIDPKDYPKAATTNTLLPDWQQLWEAVRIDLTIRKTAQPSIRQYFYNIFNRPDATKTNKVIDMWPWGVVFEEMVNSGQSIPQGERMGFDTDTFDIKIYAAGFTWDLLAELFDEALDMTMLNDAVALGESALKDYMAIYPILNYASYGGAGTTKHTKAATLTGANRQELLYLTLQDAIDGLAKRTDPYTKRKISATDLVLLGTEYDARHAASVIGGLPSVNERRYPGLSEITAVVGYDGETISLRDKDVTYGGNTDGTMYLCKKNRFMDIFTKRGLTAEIDLRPDVKTLAREERAWWFAEGLYAGGSDYAYGPGSFVQKITLPTW